MAISLVFAERISNQLWKLALGLSRFEHYYNMVLTLHSDIHLLTNHKALLLDRHKRPTRVTTNSPHHRRAFISR